MNIATTVMLMLGLLSAPAPAPVTADGPRCTYVYPRGFTVPRGTKRHPLSLCTNGHLQSTWGACTLRYSA